MHSKKTFSIPPGRKFPHILEVFPAVFLFPWKEFSKHPRTFSVIFPFPGQEFTGFLKKETAAAVRRT
jgi:hypothetical protein